MRTIFYLIAIYFLLTPSLFAAIPPTFQFRHYNVSTGISSNSISALLQDSLGYIWIGTDCGLCRFDGERVLILNSEHDTAFANNVVTSCHIAGKMIWIGTEEGIYLYDMQKNTFKAFDAIAQDGSRITSWVTCITTDRTGDFWIATNSQGVYRYNPRSRKLRHYTTPEQNNRTVHILCDSENNVWVSGDSQIFQLDRTTGTLVTLSLPAFSSTVMFEDETGNLWIGTWEEGLWKYDPTTHSLENLLPANQPDAPIHIHSIQTYTPGVLLLSSDCGLTVFDVHTRESRLYTCRIDEGGLSDRFVYPILKDKEGGIWIGTYYNGINYVPPASGQFEQYRFQAHSLFMGKIVSRFCQAEDGNVWIGSNDGGLGLFSPRERTFLNFLHREELSGLNIQSLCTDRYGRLWIGTYAKGIKVLDPKTGLLVTLQEGNSFYALYTDSQGDLWASSLTGIYQFNTQLEEISFLQNIQGTAIDIEEDKTGRLWFATDREGVYCYNPHSKTWKGYGRLQGMAGSHATAIHQDKEGRLWVSASTGLFQFLPQEERFERMPLQLPSQDIRGILEDEDGLWLTTARGLVKHPLSAEEIQVFTESDGLQSETFVGGAVGQTDDGLFYIGSINGFNVFHPYRLKRNTLPPNIVIAGLEVLSQTGNESNLHSESAPGKRQPAMHPFLPLPAGNTEEIHLSYRENIITISYAALSFCAPDKTQYAYRLDGLDENWHNAGSQRSASYSGLAPGTYLFRVRGSNNDNIWSRKEATLRIIVYPPFYLSSPFKIGYTVLLLCLAGLFIRFLLLRNNRKHAQAIEQLNTAKEQEVYRAKIDFFTTVAHEIRTPVSLIIAPIEKLACAAKNSSNQPLSPADMQEDLETARRNGKRLLHLVNQLLDFRKIERNSPNISFVSQPLKPLMEAVCERFRSATRQRQITYTIGYPPEDFQADVDKEALTKVLSNLLMNALKYTNNKIQVNFAEQPVQATFSIRIADNGPGIREEDKQKIFKPFYQAADSHQGTGLGLSIVKGIVESHHGVIDISSEPGQGSAFTVMLPVRQPQATAAPDTFFPTGEALPADILPPQDPLSSSETKHTILIAEDNPDMLHFLSENLKDTYNIVQAKNGKQAAAQLKECEVSLVVSDWMMPEVDGAELCRIIRNDAQTCHIPFILLTAKTDDESKAAGMRCGADAYIEKPFSLIYLQACIQNLLDMRARLQRMFSQTPTAPATAIASSQSDATLLERMTSLIEENLTNPDLSVDFLAERLCVSRSGLFAKIKGLAAITPNEMIQLIRLKKAAHLLMENQYRISEVSYMVGFSSPSYFSRCFLKQFGMKPIEFVAHHSGQTKSDASPAQPSLSDKPEGAV